MKKILLLVFALTAGIASAQWYDQELNDEFGDPSGTIVTQQVDRNGLFSNSATINSELMVMLRKGKTIRNGYNKKASDDNFTFTLWEYNKHIVKISQYRKGVYWSFKTEDGQKFKAYSDFLSLTGWSGKSKVYRNVYGSDVYDLLKKLEGSGEVKVFATADGSTYKFTLFL